MATRAATTIRPELVEIKGHIKNLKKEAEMRLALDVEAQQSFEFLSDQVQGLRKAFSTLSDVLIEEVDVIRSEAAQRHDEVDKQFASHAKGLKAVRVSLAAPEARRARRPCPTSPRAQVRTELALLRTETQSGRSTLQSKISSLEERLESMQGDLTLLAQVSFARENAHMRLSARAGAGPVAGWAGHAHAAVLDSTRRPPAHLSLNRW